MFTALGHIWIKLEKCFGRAEGQESGEQESMSHTELERVRETARDLILFHQALLLYIARLSWQLVENKGSIFCYILNTLLYSVLLTRSIPFIAVFRSNDWSHLTSSSFSDFFPISPRTSQIVNNNAYIERKKWMFIGPGVCVYIFHGS